MKSLLIVFVGLLFVSVSFAASANPYGKWCDWAKSSSCAYKSAMTLQNKQFSGIGVKFSFMNNSCVYCFAGKDLQNNEAWKQCGAVTISEHTTDNFIFEIQNPGYNTTYMSQATNMDIWNHSAPVIGNISVIANWASFDAVDASENSLSFVSGNVAGTMLESGMDGKATWACAPSGSC